MRIIDLSGRSFDRLTVLGRDYAATTKKTMWLCRCACGSVTSVEGYKLRQGYSRSCGCLTAERAVETNLVDASGLTFGRLTAIERVEQAKGEKSLWRCICSCGKEAFVRIDKLRSSHTTSCGCARNDQPRLSSEAKRAENILTTGRRRAREAGAGGKFTAADVSNLYTKQRGCCANCGCALGDKFHRDHRVPLARGGSNDITNIELLCDLCNLRKQAKDPIDWAKQNGRLI